MRRLSLIFISAGLLFSLLLPACVGNKIRIATDATWQPFEYVNEKTRQIEGFDIDLMNEIAGKAGLQIEYVNDDFESLLDGVARCRYDAAISSITITDRRKNAMAFSEPYIIAGQVVVVRKDNTDIKGNGDLVGKQVGAQAATTGAGEVTKIKGASLKTYEKIELAYRDLMDRRLDAVVADNPIALVYVGKNPDKLKMAGNVFTAEYYGIAVCKNKTELLAKINSGLKTCLSEGLIDKLIDKWLSKPN